MLEISNITAGYGRVPILNQLSLRLETGEFVGVLGHNGMGKTTLMRALMGLIPLWSGEVRVGGMPLGRMPVHARARLGIGYVPQGRRIFPRLTVKENLMMPAIAAGSATAVEQVIEDLPQLKPLLARQGGLLSGGEQQILALGRCLVGKSCCWTSPPKASNHRPSIKWRRRSRRCTSPAACRCCSSSKTSTSSGFSPTASSFWRKAALPMSSMPARAPTRPS